MTFDDFEIVIGLEIHVRLNTKSKAFCSDLNEYGNPPNSNISVISLAHPGSLPFVNKSQIQKAIKMGLALGSEISTQTYFDRKHYFYPDLPKGYQLTQDKMPICIGGKINIPDREIRIHHIHMEEDAGKLIHSDNSNESYVDHNRAGVPLLEIVTEPDLRSGQEVHDFMQSMIQLIEWIDISDANLEEGSFRCDCNVSIRPKGASKLGERCEIKNLNSKKFARQAVESEARRQYDVIKEGGAIKNQTMSFDPVSGKTTPTRSKESVHDYRYFQDPDLLPIQLSSELIESLNNEIHPLPTEVI
jgi:aspartyl-tRNA(Asn)/glutamyl-tRNA(Gln) amidotransferase subunit B